MTPETKKHLRLIKYALMILVFIWAAWSAISDVSKLQHNEEAEKNFFRHTDKPEDSASFGPGRRK